MIFESYASMALRMRHAVSFAAMLSVFVCFGVLAHNDSVAIALMIGKTCGLLGV